MTAKSPYSAARCFDCNQPIDYRRGGWHSYRGGFSGFKLVYFCSSGCAVAWARPHVHAWEKTIRRGG